MVFNPSPKVADCREIARKWGMKQVIIIALNEDANQVQMATYGETKALCEKTKALGDAAYAAIGEIYANEEMDTGDGAGPCGSGVVIDEYAIRRDK